MNKTPLLTIGMAHANDFDGAYFTIQSLFMHHDMEDVEVLVVDNTPDTAQGKELKKFMSAWHPGHPYLPMSEKSGTSQTRNRVFEAARGEFVMCMDCHVLLIPHAVSHLKSFLRGGLFGSVAEHKDDLFTGPMLYDSMHLAATHFDMAWRKEMWGIWAQAWGCPKCGSHVSLRGLPSAYKKQNSGDVDRCGFFSMTVDAKPLTRCLQCGTAFPVNLPWAGSHQTLVQKGFKLGAGQVHDEPFRIPAMGLGLFLAKRSSWLGFNKEFRGFGGEEGYIHRKYELAGRGTWTLPFLRWNHRFPRPNGVPYVLNVYDKLRNYVIGFKEIGRDLKELHQHFVLEGNIPEAAWNELLRDPVGFKTEPVQQSSGQLFGVGHPTPASILTMEETYDWVRRIPRDLDQHFDRLRSYASRCEHVTEFTKRRESTVALLAAMPKVLSSFQSEQDPLITHYLPQVLRKTTGQTMWHNHVMTDPSLSVGLSPIEPTDMLFIDTVHRGDHVYQELKKHGSQVRRYLVFHDVTSHGKHGEGDGPGLLLGIKRWVEEQEKEWFVCDITPDQYGLLVLSCNEEDRPPMQLHAWPPAKGVGTELKKLLKLIGIEATENCSCNHRANLMDINGPEWCKENIETILDWLQEEADKRAADGSLKIPFVRLGARMMVKRAIRNAEKAKRDEK